MFIALVAERRKDCGHRVKKSASQDLEATLEPWVLGHVVNGAQSDSSDVTGTILILSLQPLTVFLDSMTWDVKRTERI